ncbi:MAG: Na/Pi symporter [Oscillospiraceae bacterium]
MSIFDVLTMLGGLCLFLFGMTLMGQALERRAGGRLRSLLGKMTTGRLAGFFTGLGVTAVIQSSSATTVMVVGFVNSGLMTLRHPSTSSWGQRRHHGDGMVAESGRHQRRQHMGAARSPPPLRRCWRWRASSSSCSARTIRKRTPARCRWALPR